MRVGELLHRLVEVVAADVGLPVLARAVPPALLTQVIERDLRVADHPGRVGEDLADVRDVREEPADDAVVPGGQRAAPPPAVELQREVDVAVGDLRRRAAQLAVVAGEVAGAERPVAVGAPAVDHRLEVDLWCDGHVLPPS